MLWFCFNYETVFKDLLEIFYKAWVWSLNKKKTPYCLLSYVNESQPNELTFKSYNLFISLSEHCKTFNSFASERFSQQNLKARLLNSDTIKILIIFSSISLCPIRNGKYQQEIDLTDTNVACSPVHQLHQPCYHNGHEWFCPDSKPRTPNVV